MRLFTNILISLGTILLLSGLGLLLLIFYPIILQEIGYDIYHTTTNLSASKTSTTQQKITPVDKDFGIVIPKIRANSKIIANVDPYNEAVYQWALTKGVAQAKGTSLPYEAGNMFLFSHSSVNFYEAQKYNSIFYLLNKLEKKDIIDIYYKGEKYEYQVIGKKIVDPKDVSYLRKDSAEHTLTLMTCWPPGTSLQRLLVEGVQVSKK